MRRSPPRELSGVIAAALNRTSLDRTEHAQQLGVAAAYLQDHIGSRLRPRTVLSGAELAAVVEAALRPIGAATANDLLLVQAVLASWLEYFKRTTAICPVLGLSNERAFGGDDLRRAIESGDALSVWYEGEDRRRTMVTFVVESEIANGVYWSVRTESGQSMLVIYRTWPKPSWWIVVSAAQS